MTARMVPDLCPFHFEGHTQFGGNPPHQRLIRGTAAASQLMVQVGGREFPIVFVGQIVEEMQQDHRVDSARYGNKDSLSVPKEPLCLNGPLDLLAQITHAEGICRGRIEVVNFAFLDWGTFPDVSSVVSLTCSARQSLYDILCAKAAYALGNHRRTDLLSPMIIQRPARRSGCVERLTRRLPSQTSAVASNHSGAMVPRRSDVSPR